MSQATASAEEVHQPVSTLPVFSGDEPTPVPTPRRDQFRVRAKRKVGKGKRLLWMTLVMLLVGGGLVYAYMHFHCDKGIKSFKIIALIIVVLFK